MSFLFYNFSFGFPFFRFRKCLFLPIIPLFYLFACQETDIPHKTQHTQHHQTDTSKTTSLPASTQEMVNELRHIALNPNNKDMWYLNEQKAKKYEAMLPQLTNTPNQWINTAYQAATQWLNAGNYNHAIELLDQTFAFIKTQNVQLQQNEINTLLEVKAISFMRKGEIENCLHNHNEYSCLLPIEGPGQHLNKTGSQSALHIYEQLLQYDPDNPQNKWLYNIAHMTLSSYPHDVDKKHLIPPGVFHSEANFPRFTDIAMPLGIAVNDISGSVILDDFNNDHYLDIIASSYGLQDQLRYFQNDGHGGFTDKTQEAGLMGLWSGLNLKQADYNNDGWMDILVLRGAWMGAQGKHPNSLLLNQGNGTFRDVTKEAGLYSLFPTQTAAWGDFDNDGWLDLFIANESSRFISAPCLLFHNNGDGTFSEIAASMGLNKTGFFKGCAWGDINNDGWLDLYLSNLTGKNLLFLNNGKGTAFQDISLSAGISEPNFSFPCWFFDYNQDGWEDIFVSGFDIRQFETAAGEVAKDYLGLPTTAEKPRLYRNNRNNTFTDVSKELHLDKVLYTMGCNYGDLNNDGYPDFYAATGTPDFRALIPNRMFLNHQGKVFKDVTTAGGFGHLQKGHGIAFGDIDADGDQDIYAVLGGSYSGDNFMNALFQNPGNDHHYIILKLEGTSVNKAAIGAKVKITVDSPSGEKTFYNRLSSGASFGANPLRIEQGLGNASSIKKVEILWSLSQNPEIFENLEMDNFYHIVQGQGKAQKINLPKIQFRNKGHHH